MYRVCSLALSDVLNARSVDLLILLLSPEAFLLLSELVQKVASFAEKLLRRQLPVLELLHFLLAQAACRLPLTKLLTELIDTCPPNLLFL